MKYFSEITKQYYDTDKECLKAEKDFAEATRKKEEAAAKAANERKIRAKEIEDAHKATTEARKHEYELLMAFLKDYGSYHTSYSTEDTSLSPLETLFKLW